MTKDTRSVQKILLGGSIGVIPTDTIYGIVGLALNKRTVERIYKVRKRNLRKPFIILIGSMDDLRLFSINPGQELQKMLKKVWPGKISIILPCPLKKFFYLHRGKNSLAFRLPDNKKLLYLLKKTGPLVAPSANPEGFLAAETIGRAKKYFGNTVDFYTDGGKISSAPSKIIWIKKGRVDVLREGTG